MFKELLYGILLVSIYSSLTYAAANPEVNNNQNVSNVSEEKLINNITPISSETNIDNVAPNAATVTQANISTHVSRKITTPKYDTNNIKSMLQSILETITEQDNERKEQQNKIEEKVDKAINALQTAGMQVLKHSDGTSEIITKNNQLLARKDIQEIAQAQTSVQDNIIYATTR
ncbi:MAG: hypothetical protein IJ848_00805 [Alphaproteobacteria bacterium]|nr:hypothetical protein [Alphaproteobacteria bacterium]